MRQKSHPIKSAWSTSKLACILITWVILCLLVRITIKDRFPLIAAIYYAGPLVTCGMWLILAAALFLHKRRYRFAAALAIAGILLAVAWCINSYQQNELPSQEAHLRIIFWNLGRGDASQSLQFLVEQYHPDTVAMVESGALEDKPSEFWETHFAGYRFHYAGGGVSVLIRISCACWILKKSAPAPVWPVLLWAMATPNGASQ